MTNLSKPEDTVKEPEKTESQKLSMVEPIQSVHGTEVPELRRPTTLTDCWNCHNKLDKKGICEGCGFELDKLHNVWLDTDRRQYFEAVSAQQ